MNKIIQGDCLSSMVGFNDSFIDLTLTSPPYDNLRKYDEYDYKSFDFRGVANELYRITKEGGIVVWVVGDATIKGSESGSSFEQALYFKEIGFNIHDTMIYKSEKPPLTHNRYEQKFEYMFVFSKGRPRVFNPIKEKCKYFGCSTDRPETTKGSRSDNSAVRSKVGKGKTVNEFKIKGNIWEYKTGGGHSSKDKIAFNHPAIFPEKLAEDHILSWSNEGDLVFDPMAGSGTTLKMAKKLNRKYLGIEVSSKYVGIIENRLGVKCEEHEEKNCITCRTKPSKRLEEEMTNELLKKCECGGKIKVGYCEDCLKSY